jgi:hypothetical protein
MRICRRLSVNRMSSVIEVRQMPAAGVIPEDGDGGFCRAGGDPRDVVSAEYPHPPEVVGPAVRNADENAPAGPRHAHQLG